MDDHPAVTGTSDGTGPNLSVPTLVGDIDQWCETLRELLPSATALEAEARIGWFERLGAVLAAAQAREAVAFQAHRKREDETNGLPKRKQGIYAGHEIALVKGTSPATGRDFLTSSTTLVNDLPHTFSALSEGTISESRARTVAKATAGLSHDQRVKVDAELPDLLPRLGTRQLGKHVRALAEQASGASAAERADAAAEERHVSFTALENGMSRISATVPTVQATAVFDALREESRSIIADGDAGGRTPAQIMADVFITSMTGQRRPGDIPVQVHVVMEAESLFADGSVPAWLPGRGPMPAKTAREFVAENEARTFLRRMFTAPDSGQLVSMDSRSRKFDGLLRQMLVFRDDVCRTPFCDAPIQHADHVRSASAGGATEWANASGLCAACNYAKEHPGWSHEGDPDSLTVTTPTGSKYEVKTPPLVTKHRRSPIPRAGPPLDVSAGGEAGDVDVGADVDAGADSAEAVAIGPPEDVGTSQTADESTDASEPSASDEEEFSNVEFLFRKLVLHDTG